MDNPGTPNIKIVCPVQTVDLPGVPDLGLRGLIVIVGPNSSGKTQFLHDINEAVCGRKRQLVVASAILFRKPPAFDEYFDLFLEQGVIRESSKDQFLKRSLQFGTDEGSGSFHKNHLQSWHSQFLSATEQKVKSSLPGYDFLQQLGPLSCSALFLRNRLILMDECPTFDHRTAGPSKTLQSLYWSKEAKAALCVEAARVFRHAVWVDNTRHGKLVLRVSDSPEMPTAEDRLEPEEMENYRTIETEGDGLRSYMAISASLLLETRPLCIVDEPEMCLHPPQAHAMGRFIGGKASDDTCTLVATHSSHILRGILETHPKAHVIRLTHVATPFRARTLTPELLEEAISKPRSRSEAILEGLLSNAVVLCEAEGDRLVYESTYRTFADHRLDIRFIPSEGTGGFAAPLRLYRALEVPVAIVADLDFLAKDGELKKVLTGLGTPDPEVASLCKRARLAISHIRSQMSPIDPEGIQNELKTLSQEPIDLAKNGDSKLRGDLQRIIRELYKLHLLQQQGLEAIPKTIDADGIAVSLRSDVRALLWDLGSHGLFLVPVGELESWLPVIMKGHSREDKSKWAMLAAEKIEDSGERDDDIWKWFHTVYDFLEKCVRSLSTVPAQQ